MQLSIGLSLSGRSGVPRPSLSLSASTMPENGAQNADIATLSFPNAISPGAASVTNISLANALQMNADGVTLEYGSAAISVDFYPVIVADISYTDASGPHTFRVTLTVTRVGVPHGGTIALHYDVPADETAPALTSPTGTATGGTSATGTVTTDEANGTLYRVTTTSATQPSEAQILAGQDHTGAAANNASQAIASTGVKTFTITGLTATTTYYNHYLHVDVNGFRSNRASSASFTTGANILFVGMAKAQGQGGTTTLSLAALTGGIDTAPAPGDLVLVYSGITNGSDVAVGVSGSTGWTETAEQYANGSSRDANARVATKIMGATPDANIVVLGGANAAYQNFAMAFVLRNVDQTTPLDVAIVLSSLGNSADMNPPSATPVTAGAMVICGAIASSAKPSVAPTGAPTGFSNLASDKRDGTGIIGGCIAMATMLWSGSGAVDPSAFTGNLGEAGGGSPSTVDGVCRFTAVIRPA